MRNCHAVVVFGITVIASLVAGARGDDEKIPLEKVPAAVTKAVMAKFPNAKIEEASKEVEDGKTTYELEIEDGETDISVSLREDGTILEVEKEIAPDALPAAVTQGVKAKYPQAVVKKAEEVTAGEKVTFEVEIALLGKKGRELELDQTGKVLEDEETESDDD